MWWRCTVEEVFREMGTWLRLLEEMGGRFVLCCVVTSRYGSSRDVVLESRNEVVMMIMMMMMIATTIQDTHSFFPIFDIYHVTKVPIVVYIFPYTGLPI